MTITAVKPRPRRIEPLRTTPLSETAAAPSDQTHRCDTCGCAIRMGHVVTIDHKWYQEYQMHGVVRIRYCVECNDVEIWTEAADAQGNPMQVRLIKPGRVKSQSLIERWLKQYPQLKAIEE